MREENGSRLFAPERYRAYLHLLARLNLPRRLRGVLSASDVAHDTILKAHSKRAQFRGQTAAEYRAWLQRILANRIADAARGKEPEILQALERSSAVFEVWVVSEGPSPAEQVVQAELLLRLAEGLMQLSDDERTRVKAGERVIVAGAGYGVQGGDVLLGFCRLLPAGSSPNPAGKSDPAKDCRPFPGHERVERAAIARDGTAAV